MNLANYYYYFQSALPPRLCDDIIKYGTAHKTETAITGGVERDDVRAFEWYLRSSMKGHPGAQSGVGWYYEIGRGLPAPDLVRAYMWYGLSAIGGDPDAAISQEEVIKKMTPEQIEKAHILIKDYKSWIYPFR